MTCGSMKALFLRRIGSSRPALRRDGERKLVHRDVASWTGKIGGGWSVETRDSAIPDKLASVVELVDLDGMMAIKTNSS